MYIANKFKQYQYFKNKTSYSFSAYPNNSSNTHSSSIDAVDAPPAYGGGPVYNVPMGPPQYYSMQSYPIESPPKYEDIVKDQNGAQVNQVWIEFIWT